MEKTDKLPLWVYLALSSIKTRKSALLLTLTNLLFTAYCIPWVSFYQNIDWVAQLFLIDDWEWFLMSAPMTVWYWLSIKWVDRNRGWQTNNI